MESVFPREPIVWLHSNSGLLHKAFHMISFSQFSWTWKC